VIVVIGVSIAARDRVLARDCGASVEDTELASPLAAFVERFGFEKLTREPRGTHRTVSWRHAPAE
jgi:hypothetical protein